MFDHPHAKRSYVEAHMSQDGYVELALVVETVLNVYGTADERALAELFEAIQGYIRHSMGIQRAVIKTVA